MPNYPDAITRHLWEKAGEHPSVLDFGAKGDGVSLTDFSISGGSNAASSASAAFTAEDVGKLVVIFGAGASGAALSTTIATVVGPGSITLTASAGTGVSGAYGKYGTDNRSAIQAGLDSVPTANRARLFVPAGHYLVSGSLLCHDNTHLVGESMAMLAQGQFAGHEEVFSSKLSGTGAWPILDQNDAENFAVHLEFLSFEGVPDLGSKGVHAALAYNWTVRWCFFDQFGSQAIHIEAGVICSIHNNFTQNTVMEHSGWTDWVGGIDIGATDCDVQFNQASTSFTANGTDRTVTGYVCGILLNAPNGFAAFNQGAQSEVGILVKLGPMTLVGNRADLNQKEGFHILATATDIQMTGNWAWRNSQAGDGLYDGFVNDGPGNSFINNRTSGLDADTIQHNNGFSDADNRTDSGLRNTYVGNTSRIIRGKNYNFTGVSKKILALEYTTANNEVNPDSAAEMLFYDSTNRRLGLNTLTPTDTLHISEPINVTGGDIQAGVTVDSGNPVLGFISRYADTDNMRWFLRCNSAPGLSQLFLSIWDDEIINEAIVMKITRTLQVINSIIFPSGPFIIGDELDSSDMLQVNGNIRLRTNGQKIIFGTAGSLITNGSGSPEGVVTAVGGSLYLDTSGNGLYIKVSGTGNTGWHQASYV